MTIRKENLKFFHNYDNVVHDERLERLETEWEVELVNWKVSISRIVRIWFRKEILIITIVYG